ncbi:MAG TPA: papain-like cysteine protease family protein [Kofleriaceae bacterium]|nr:papain-like cysteine protease family protein [Kofleriaceae bacterium]
MIRRLAACAIALALAGACSTYRGTAHTVTPAQLAREPGWILIRDVPYVAQEQETECGAAAIGMIVGFWTGKPARQIMTSFRPVSEQGIEAGKLRDYARGEGLAAYLIEGKLEDISREIKAGRPVLVGLSKPQRGNRVLQHYEVVVGVHGDRQLIVTLDPQAGWRQNTVVGFYKEWKLAGFVTLVTSAKPAPVSTPTSMTAGSHGSAMSQR